MEYTTTKEELFDEEEITSDPDKKGKSQERFQFSRLFRVGFKEEKTAFQPAWVGCEESQ